MVRTFLFVPPSGAPPAGPSGTYFDLTKTSAHIGLDATQLIATGQSGVVSAESSQTNISHDVTGQLYYWEMVLTNDIAGNEGIGIVNGAYTPGTQMGSADNNSLVIGTDGNIYFSNFQVLANIGVLTSGDVVCNAINGNNFWARRNGGNWNGDAGADPATFTGSVNVALLFNNDINLFPAIHLTTDGASITARFTTPSYGFSVPSGYGNW